MEELIARIRALKRRQTTQIEMVLEHRELVLNPANHTVTLRGRPLEITAREFSLLEIFLENAGRLLTRSLLIEKVWDVDYDVDSNLLDVYMSRLRGKLEAGSEKPYFETVRGMGYKML
jgi:two-component system copper resistance phosphate regulon response regulator CusR/two-component system response regulator QseB